MYRIIATLLLFSSSRLYAAQCFEVDTKKYQLVKEETVIYLSLQGEPETLGYVCGQGLKSNRTICQAEDDSGSFELLKNGMIKLSKNHDFGTPDNPRYHHFDKDQSYQLKDCVRRK
jgi:hypothetical protein